MMYAHCVYCPAQFFGGSVDNTETWAANHEKQGGKHSVKVEGYEQNSGEFDGKA